jgi:hypothetical protein
LSKRLVCPIRRQVDALKRSFLGAPKSWGRQDNRQPLLPPLPLLPLTQPRKMTPHHRKKKKMTRPPPPRPLKTLPPLAEPLSRSAQRASRAPRVQPT